MADDRMKNDDLQRNMGSGAKDQDYGQQAPGRTGQQGGQQTGGRGGTQDKSNYGSGQNKHDMEDDDLDTGKTGGQGRGGQNR